MCHNSIICYANFHLVEEHFSYLSKAGIVISLILGALALVAALIPGLWFPKLKKYLSAHKPTAWMAKPQFGRIIPFAVALIFFPVSGLFSASPWTFWLFLLFGWGAAAILLYTGKLIDSINH